MKRLLRLSEPSIVRFINGLFGKNHPLDSTVEYPGTESVSRNLKRLLSDMIVIIDGRHAYHIEAEIRDDENIAVRVFEYGFAQGLRAKTTSDDGKKISVKFPDARIRYLETKKHTPDEVTLSLEFPGGSGYEYTVKTFKFLEYEMEELKRRGLTILLPFYVLKLRKRVVAARKASTRAKLYEEMRSVLDELVSLTERAVRENTLTESDGRTLLECTEMLYQELYQQDDELKGADTMLKETILTYSEEAELRGREEGREEGRKEMMKNLLANGISPDIIAKSAGLSLERVQALVN